MKKSSIVLLFPLAIVAGQNDSDDDSRPQQTQQPKCSLYLAPSSFPGVSSSSSGGVGGGSGMGVFAGVDYAPGSIVGQPDIVVPVVDVSAQIGSRKNRFSEDDGDHHSFDWHWSDYVWEPRALGVAGEGVDAKAAAPGLGSLVRGSNGVVEPNVMPARAGYDSAGLHRSRDANAGGISYYHNMRTVATRPIQAGSELLSDFGTHYFSGGAEEGEGGLSLNDLEGPDSAGQPNGALWGMLWDDNKGGAFKRMMPRVASGGVSADQGVAASGTAVIGAAAADGKRGNHSTEWLSTHGYCLDNIVPGLSTVRTAGRGAFAARALRAGEVIAPAPVIHLPDRNVLDIRSPRDDLHNAESHGDVLTDEVTGRQLLLNYCFGHSDSSMLLCPIGAVTSLVNHAPSSASPNAEIRWSQSTSGMSNATWLNMSLDELDRERSIGLVLEYVALRDIGAGEEILIDYGNEWEEAWSDHVESWRPREDSGEYVDAAELNHKYGQDVAVRTIQEQAEDPYPTNVQTSCYYEYVPDAGGEAEDDEDKTGSPRIVSRRWLYGMDRAGTNLRPCRILKRYTGDDGGVRYAARILNSEESHHEARIPSNERVVVNDVPRRAIVFTNRPYTTDMHLTNAFRHEMMMPDDVFPDAWRNLS